MKYRTARGFRVVPYNRAADIIGDNLVADAEFAHSGYGFIIGERHSDNDESRLISEIDQETALLLLSQQQAGPLPDYVQREFSQEMRNGMLNLLYSGFLEMEADGKFITGHAVADYLTLDQQNSESGLIQILSHQALQRADKLGLIYADQLFSYLYQYQFIPVSPMRRAQLADDKAFLKLDELNPYWRYSDSLEGWHYFAPREGAPSKAIAKLYISPMPDYLPDVLRVTSNVLSHYPEVSFKVGQGSMGILRADKLVAYFSNLETLMQAADELNSALEGVAPHGVPFTSRLRSDGLISWGMDPKQANGERKSWRQWVIEKMVGFMLRDRPEDIGDNRWKTALKQLELEGINPNTFRPGGSWITQHS